MLRDVWRSLFRKPATRKYPFERHPAPARLRGVLHFNPEKCTGCGMCIRDCPANAIELLTLDKKNKRFVLRYHIDRCTYCAQCIETCSYNCLEMSNDQWELAALDKQPFTVLYGNESDVQTVLDRFARGETDTVKSS
jgi:formate hydrogenlyase subunit 6/NADH:ubiquinone oxidoreductase subunit I